MNFTTEINSLAGETLALQAIIVGLCTALSRSGLDSQVASAFDAAADFTENFAIKTGSGASPEHLVHSLRVVEELRAAVLGNPAKPKDAV